MNLTIGNYKETFADLNVIFDQIQDDMIFTWQVKEHATGLINYGFGGNIRMYSDRVLLRDTDDEMTAEKVWQLNINGFGYSSAGISGSYGLAVTMDG